MGFRRSLVRIQSPRYQKALSGSNFRQGFFLPRTPDYMVGRLLREEGLLAGGTSGTTVVAALRVAQSVPLDGPVVVILADSWIRYFTK
jgi:hypothetical protein